LQAALPPARSGGRRGEATTVSHEQDIRLEAAASLFDAAADELGYVRTGEDILVAQAREHRRPPDAVG
jgi:hypothetical protein